MNKYIIICFTLALFACSDKKESVDGGLDVEEIKELIRLEGLEGLVDISDDFYNENMSKEELSLKLSQFKEHLNNKHEIEMIAYEKMLSDLEKAVSEDERLNFYINSEYYIKYVDKSFLD